MNIQEPYCVLDIETKTIGELPNADVDELKYVGFKNYLGAKVCYHYTERKKIQQVLNFFPYLIGHNINNYDIPILKRHGFYNNSIIIDTFIITQNRLKTMMYIDLNQGDRSLKKLCERFDLPHKKGEFDYDLLKKDQLNDLEYSLLLEYLYGDLDAADDLFKFYYEFFLGFKEYMNETNQEKMYWLVNPPGSTAYKCICNLANLPEEYDEVDEDKKDDILYQGGYVSEPYLDYIEG